MVSSHKSATCSSIATGSEQIEPNRQLECSFPVLEGKLFGPLDTVRARVGCKSPTETSQLSHAVSSVFQSWSSQINRKGRLKEPGVHNCVE